MTGFQQGLYLLGIYGFIFGGMGFFWYFMVSGPEKEAKEKEERREKKKAKK